VIAVIRELEKDGLTSEAFDRIYAPMGFGIGAVSPEEIAISVAAEMIAVRRDPDGNWRTLSKSIFLNEHMREKLLATSAQADGSVVRSHE
jgi:xanthine dehydrogenase accessory factor